MVRRFVCVAGIIVILVLLLVAVVHVQGAFVSAEWVEDSPLVCLALVGGTALLAGSVWMGRLRRMLP
ncbi:MAG: hypothetical protein SWK90_02190 [Chloroflexota bacterium]|nr:hypothetical protein [Chloroflexota bacterium]